MKRSGFVSLLAGLLLPLPAARADVSALVTPQAAGYEAALAAVRANALVLESGDVFAAGEHPVRSRYVFEAVDGDGRPVRLTRDIRYGAARGWVDAILDPTATRQTLIAALEVATRHAAEEPYRLGVYQV